MGVIKKISEKDTNEIVRLYSTGECCSKEKIGKMFGTSKRVVSRILEENDVETIRTGTRNKIIPVNEGKKYIEGDEYVYIARHKVTGKEFKDYNNVSGALISYIQNENPEIEIPTKFIRSSYYKRTGNYWYEQYFDIIKIPIKKKKGELYAEDIKEIVRLYQTKEVPSTHRLGEMFKVGHRKISEILKEHEVSINKIGGFQLYSDSPTNKYIETDDEHVYKAIHKETGAIFDDYNNISGSLTRYISENNKDAIIPTLDSQKKHYFLDTGNYWYEQYFDIVNFKKSDLKIKNCPYCGNDIDMSVSGIKYKNHILKTHNIKVEDHIKKYKEDSEIFKIELDFIEKRDNEDNWVTCAICGEKFGVVSASHLKKHGITAYEYRMKYGTNVSVTSHNIMSESAIAVNASGRCITYSSKPEIEVRDYLTSIGIKFETNRQILIGKEIDILSHEYKIGIEFDGLKWHTEWFGKKDRYYHLNKLVKCKEKGYSLIHIFEDEWVNHREIVQHKLKHIFKKDTDLIKIGARKTIVKEVQKPDVKDFLNKYHIQGSGQSAISYGAYYNNKLIAVMTFKKLVADNNDYGLTRFATDYNYICQGVGSKLLKHFIRDYNPDSIISFADKRWTLDKDNNLYTKLGFTLDHQTNPDYRYYNEKIDKFRRFHKFGFNKEILHKKYGLDLSMTEIQMVQSLGYDRIWDCGLFKYKLICKK
jgi:hypothetical protein